jgi:hypothetical protein
MATLQIGGEWQTLKLGRKKDRSLSRSKNRGFGNLRLHDYLSPSHQIAAWAVPVADSRTSAKKVEGDANVT